MLYRAELSQRASVITIIIALVAAIKFTSWYQKAVERQAKG
jgi:hypothetical protein